MKVYALALWILSSLDADTIAKVRTGIETNGVYSAFHGNWWIRLTKSRGDIYGQMDEVGTGARTKLMENQLNIAMPQARYEGLALLIPEQELTLDMLIEAEGIPSLKAINSRFERVAQFSFASNWETLEQDDLWKPSFGKEKA
tara:strand:- start:6960 stop:7388 length:429 start_codon:yes stop_codon:yes gene_type:complete